MSDFEKCVEYSCNDGTFKVTCIKGLWSVAGNDKIQVEHKALHYFEQYREDGEYYDIIGGLTPIEILIKLREN